jgi:hypothetical protein
MLMDGITGFDLDQHKVFIFRPISREKFIYLDLFPIHLGGLAPRPEIFGEILQEFLEDLLFDKNSAVE